MTTLDRFATVDLAGAATQTPADSGRTMIVVVAIGFLFLTARFMLRSVGPVIEILKAALAAVTSFVLITVVVLLLLWSLLAR